jgi:hypothetical protein
MKKVLAILALALFLGGISAPAIAAISDNAAQIVLAEDEPKKKETKKAKKSEKATTKSSDCSKSCEGESKKSDCSK